MLICGAGECTADLGVSVVRSNPGERPQECQSGRLSIQVSSSQAVQNPTSVVHRQPLNDSGGRGGDGCCSGRSITAQPDALKCDSSLAMLHSCCPWGQSPESPAQGLLIVLDRQHVVATATADPLGGVHLGVHGVGGHHDPAWVEGLKQDPESRDLVGFVRDSALGQDSAGDLVQGRQQMRGRRVAGAGAAHGLAIHGDHCAAVDGAGARAQPGRQVGVEVCGVQVLQDPSDGGLRWKVLPLLQPQRAQVGAGQVGGVLPYRRQAPAAGQHPGDGQGQDRGQVMAHAPKVPGISHVPENLDQGPARQGGRGGG